MDAENAVEQPPPSTKITAKVTNEARTAYRADKTLTVTALAEQHNIARGVMAAALRGKKHRFSGVAPIYTLRPEPGLKEWTRSLGRGVTPPKAE
jgi:hypothetical protein